MIHKGYIFKLWMSEFRTEETFWREGFFCEMSPRKTLLSPADAEILLE